MGALDRTRTGVAGRPGVTRVVEPSSVAVTPAQINALGPLIREAIARYEANPQIGSMVVPWWMPTNQFADAVAEYGVPVEIVNGVLRQMEAAGAIERRVMSIGGVQYPVARLTSHAGIDLDRPRGSIEAVREAFPQIAPPRKEILP